MDTMTLNDNRRPARAARWRRHAVTLAAIMLASSFASMAPLSAQTTPAQRTAVLAPVNHEAYDALLHRFVVNGFVDYDGFAKSPEFPRYLASLNAAKVDSLDEDERLAFWINVYNAYTIQLVVTHHETESIRNVNKTLGVLRLKGPWSEPLVHAAGRTLSLDDVQHTILRKGYNEPRVLFALACGAIGCPPLRNEAYTGAKLVDQFNDQGRLFLRESPTKNRVNGRAFFLSPVLMAYRSDFGASNEDFGRALAPWFDGENRIALEKGRFFVRETDFDWTLNSQQQARVKKLM